MTLGALLWPGRYTAFILCFVLLALSGLMTLMDPWAWLGVGLFGVLCLVGVHDLVQTRHSILRNFGDYALHDTKSARGSSPKFSRPVSGLAAFRGIGA